MVLHILNNTTNSYRKKMFALSFSVYQAQIIWLMLIYSKMKAWFCGAYENIGEQVNVVLVQQKEVKWETETASQGRWDELIFGGKQDQAH